MSKDLEIKLSVDLDFLLLVFGAIGVGAHIYRSDYDLWFYLAVVVFLAGIYYLVKYRFIKKNAETAGFEFSYKEKSNKQG